MKLENNKLLARFNHNVTKRFLDSHRWYYSKMFSDNDEPFYTYRFPVYTYGIHTTLECEFLLNYKENVIDINVFELGSRTLYAPFYYQEYGKYDSIMQIIINNIEKEMKKLGIEYVDDNSREGM